MNPDLEKNSEEEVPLKQIRTFQGDMAEALKHKGESVESLSKRERNKREEYEKAKRAEDAQALAQRQNKLIQEATITETSTTQRPVVVPPARVEPISAPYYDDEVKPESHLVRTVLLIIGSIILLGLGVGGGWYAYTQYKTKTALPSVNIPDNQFITPQSIFDIDASSLTRDTLINTIRTERGANIPTGSLHELELRDGPNTSAALVTTENFLVHYLETEAPGGLLRSFDPLFMLGTLGASPGEASAHTFMIIKLDSFENAFPGMLLWEPTMAQDLLPIFASDSTIANTASSTAFKDITIQNKDARVLKDITGKTVLLYSFYDNNYLIVTDNELSLRQIISALNAEKVVR